MLQSLFSKKVLETTFKLNENSSIIIHSERTNQFELMIFTMLCLTRAIKLKTKFHNEFNTENICNFFIRERDLIVKSNSLTEFISLTEPNRILKDSYTRKSSFKASLREAKNGNYFLDLSLGFNDVNLAAFVFIAYWVTMDMISDEAKPIFIDALAELAEYILLNGLTTEQATMVPNEILFKRFS